MFNVHIIALVPVRLPSAANWESWFELERYFWGWSVSMCRRNISNVIAYPKTSNVVWILWVEILQTVCAFVLDVVVYATPLSVYTSACVLKSKMLVYSDITPMRNFYRSWSLSKNYLRLGAQNSQAQDIELKWLYITVRTTSKTILCLFNIFVLSVRANFTFGNLNLRCLLQDLVRREDINTFFELKFLRIFNTQNWWICKQTSLMEFKNLYVNLLVFTATD